MRLAKRTFQHQHINYNAGQREQHNVSTRNLAKTTIQQDQHTELGEDRPLQRRHEIMDIITSRHQRRRWKETSLKRQYVKLNGINIATTSKGNAKRNKNTQRDRLKLGGDINKLSTWISAQIISHSQRLKQEETRLTLSGSNQQKAHIFGGQTDRSHSCRFKSTEIYTFRVKSTEISHFF